MGTRILMENPPLVSVIIPTYNRQELVVRAIKSIINQTYTNLEILVVDDASNDNTEVEVKKINDNRIKFIKNTINKGVSYSRNIGIKEAKGEIIVLQDSDDESFPNRIEEQARVLFKSDSSIGGVYCGKELIDSNTGEIINVNLTATDFKHNFVNGEYILTPGTGLLMMRKSVFEDVGYFDESLRARVDTELAIRVAKKYNYAFVNKVLVKVYRFHDQIGADIENQNRAKEILLEKHENFLSPQIVYGLYKMIINYHILTSNFSRAKFFLKKSLSHSFVFKDNLLLLGIRIFPSGINFIYYLKYKGKIPWTGGVKGQSGIKK